MYIAMGLTAFGLLMAVTLVSTPPPHLHFPVLTDQSWHWRRENKRRDKLVAEGALDQPELGDKNPHFRYVHFLAVSELTRVRRLTVQVLSIGARQ